VIKRTRLMIPDSSSRIAALARFPNPEEQSCRELSPINADKIDRNSATRTR